MWAKKRFNPAAGTVASNIGTNQPRNRAMAWKVYFWFLTAVLVALYALTFSQSAPAIYNYLDIPISLIALIGLYGYAFKKPIGHYNFWKIWLVAVVLWDISFNLVLPGRTVADPLNMAFFLIWSAIILPEYVALYLYGFRSQPLWHGATRSSANVVGP